MLLTLAAFIVALGLLIAVHEWGHYRVAVACGVKVLRFSVGFGKTLYRWHPRRQRPNQDTEFVIGAIPLGGYVKMLDEREGPVDQMRRLLNLRRRPQRIEERVADRPHDETEEEHEPNGQQQKVDGASALRAGQPCRRENHARPRSRCPSSQR